MILACNGYLGGLNRKVAARVMPINNFIAATEPLGDEAARVLTRDVAVADSKFVVNYFRLSHDKRLLFGGGESYGYRFPAISPPRCASRCRDLSRICRTCRSTTPGAARWPSR